MMRTKVVAFAHVIRGIFVDGLVDCEDLGRKAVCVSEAVVMEKVMTKMVEGEGKLC